ncbi:universal stress protein [Lentiprolixibacter aurantiacus]|uniref:Universal stress protein n=1 Tax=Lentiprolixibacter aurantiacus TaxID=2993939 RepID=A0AAE3MLR2_9FLAO|nr:universal stress protein [Lentiprolixibacter aurantiacus]MCX2720110.1 universal stress protein [Lentiprolixibacter aurantiacus]
MLRILIPTDFSQNAWNALTYGLELFRKERCTIYLLHVNPLPPYSGAGTSVKASTHMLRETMLAESEKSLKELLEKINKSLHNDLHTFMTISLYDFFVDSIKREVEDKHIDLVIMGTKGASGLKKVSLGSNTGDVITKVKCPLLAVPEQARYKIPREIAFPTDYYINYDIKVLDTLIGMVNRNEASLRVLHITRRGEELTREQLQNKDFLHDYLREVEHSFHTLTGAKLETAVQCFVESRDIDMIAMVAKNLNFFQRILFRPAVEEISYHIEIPFLVLHE